MYREVDLLSYLPLYVQNYREIQKIMESEKPEVEGLFQELYTLRQNQYILTCDEVGIERFEKLLGIVPFKSEELEKRRAKVLLAWVTDLPFTYETLEVQLTSLLTKEGFKMALYNDIYRLDVCISLFQKGMYDEVVKLLKWVVPCNIGLNPYIDYNKHRLFRPFMHKELGKFTHSELREKVIEVDEYLHKNNEYEKVKYSDLKVFDNHLLRRKGDWYSV